MGYRAEIWRRPGHATFGHVDTVEYLRAGCTRRGSGLGEGNLALPASLEAARLNQIVFGDKDTPANAVTALIRIYRDGQQSGVDAPFFEWLADARIPPANDEQPELTVSGLDINSLFGWATLEAWDWDGSVDWQSTVPDWIWGGRNILGDITARYTAERVTITISNVDDGTFTITVTNDAGTATTAALAHDITVTALDTALTGLANVTFVDVSGTPGEEYQLQFDDPSTSVTVSTDSSSLVGTWQIGVFAVGGTFTVTVDGNTSGNIAYNATAAAMKTALEAITGVTTVNVTKTESADPDHTWVVEFVTPDSATTVTADGTLLTGGGANAATLQLNAGALVTAEEQGGYSPSGWEISRSYLSEIEHGPVAEFRMWTTGDPAAPAGCTTSEIFMFDGGEPYFPGVQKVVNVTPGQRYQLHAWVTANNAGDTVRMVVRDLAEIELNGVGNARDEQTITVAGTWQEFNIVDLDIPEGVTQVIVRFGHVDEAGVDPGAIFVGCPTMREGLQMTTVGGILAAIYADAQTDHAADGRQVWGATPFLELDFDATNDSAGNAWAEAEIAVRYNMNIGYDLIIADIASRGYEFRTIPKQAKTANPADDGIWLLQVFNPGTAGTDYSAANDPAILPGTDIVARAARMFAPNGTYFRVQGADGLSSRAGNSDAITAVGRREKAVQAGDLFSLTDTAALASAQLQAAVASAESITPTLRPAGGVDPTPGIDFDVFDTLNVADAPYVAKADRRCAAWTATITPDIPDGEFLVSFTEETFVGQSAVNAGVRRLLREFEAIRRDGLDGGAGSFPFEALGTQNCCDDDAGAGTPTLSDITTYEEAEGTTTPPWTPPSSMQVGDGIVVWIALQDPSLLSVPAGYVELESDIGIAEYHVYGKIWEATDSLNDTFTTSGGGNNEIAVIWQRIDANGGTVPPVSEWLSIIGPSSGSAQPDPFPVTVPTPGRYLCLAAAMMNKGSPTPTPEAAKSTGYELIEFLQTADAGVNGPRIYLEGRTADLVSAEDPEVIDWTSSSGSRDFNVVTLLIPAPDASPTSAPFEHTHTEDEVDDIDTLTEKATPVAADRIKIYDSELADIPVYAELGNLPVGAISADDLTDVDTTTAAPAVGEALVWDGTNWVPGVVASGGGGGGGGAGAFETALLHLRDEKAQNTSGGTFTSGAWQTRTLNTEKTNEIAGASLATNQITLPAGTYWAEWEVPAYRVQRHQSKLVNTTDATDVLIGTSGYAGSSDSPVAPSMGRGRFTLNAEKVLELQHRAVATIATLGFGVEANLATEVYADIRIWKIDDATASAGFVERVNSANVDGTPALAREFADDETDDSTITEDASPNITVTKALDKLSVYHPGGDAAAELHGITWPFSPAGNFYVDVGLRFAGVSQNFNLLGPVAADGTTYGAGNQVWFAMDPSGAASGGRIRRNTNWNSQAAVGTAQQMFPNFAPLMYARLAYNSTTNVWTPYISPDGISYLALPTLTHTMSTTRVGFAISTFGSGAPIVVTCEYVRAYDGTP